MTFPISIAITFQNLTAIVFREKMSKFEEHILHIWKILNSHLRTLRVTIKLQSIRTFKL